MNTCQCGQPREYGAKCGDCYRAYMKGYMRARKASMTPEEREMEHRRATLRKYGLTPADYDRMLRDQGGGCAICGTTEPGNSKHFHVDHDHSCCDVKGKSCGKCVRGLLCNACNTGLARFQDSPRLLEEAASYLVERGILNL